MIYWHHAQDFGNLKKLDTFGENQTFTVTALIISSYYRASEVFAGG